MTTKIKDLRKELEAAILKTLKKEMKSTVSSFNVQADYPDFILDIKGVPVHMIPEGYDQAFRSEFDFLAMAEAHGIDLKSIIQEEIERLMQKDRLRKLVRDALAKNFCMLDIEDIVWEEFPALVTPIVQGVIKKALE